MRAATPRRRSSVAPSGLMSTRGRRVGGDLGDELEPLRPRLLRAECDRAAQLVRRRVRRLGDQRHVLVRDEQIDEVVLRHREVVHALDHLDAAAVQGARERVEDLGEEDVLAARGNDADAWIGGHGAVL